MNPMEKNRLSRDELMECLSYDPDSGDFRWKIRPANRCQIGDVAGYKNGSGYREIEFRGRVYEAHRLAWLFIHGNWPKNETDHINGIRGDNRICNLREATRSQNQHNRKRWARQTSSKFKGVSFHKLTGKWMAHIQTNNQPKYLGLFETEEMAFEARKMAAHELHGEFAGVG